MNQIGVEGKSAETLITAALTFALQVNSFHFHSDSINFDVNAKNKSFEKVYSNMLDIVFPGMESLTLN